MHSLAVKPLLSYGYKETKKHLWFFFTVFVVVSGLQIGPYIVNEVLKNSDSTSLHLAGIILHIGFFIIFLLVEVGLIRIALAVIEERKPKLNYLLNAEGKLIRYFIADIFYSVMVLVGLLLFVVPGVFWAVTFQFFGYALIEKNLDPTESLQFSARITKGHKWYLVKLNAILVLFNILGMLLFFVGLLITIPMSLIIFAKVYKVLSEKK